MEIDLRRRQVMAILNVTPDSFYAGSRSSNDAAIARRVEEAAAEGASIIDVGGCSTRPGASEITPEEEWRRVAAGVEAVRRIAPAMTVSVDTFRSEVAERAVERFGELIVNDISGGELDARMVPLVARMGVPYIAMHRRGTPQTMQSLTDYPRGVAAEVADYFRERITRFRAAGIRAENIVLDPGFGFAKRTEQNFELLAGLREIYSLGFPVLAGLSRKTMIWQTLGTTPDGSLAGTVALGWECLRQGAAILRVHDVRQAVDTVRLYDAYERNRR